MKRCTSLSLYSTYPCSQSPNSSSRGNEGLFPSGGVVQVAVMKLVKSSQLFIYSIGRDYCFVYVFQVVPVAHTISSFSLYYQTYFSCSFISITYSLFVSETETVTFPSMIIAYSPHKLSISLICSSLRAIFMSNFGRIFSSYGLDSSKLSFLSSYCFLGCSCHSLSNSSKGFFSTFPYRFQGVSWYSSHSSYYLSYCFSFNHSPIKSTFLSSSSFFFQFKFSEGFSFPSCHSRFFIYYVYLVIEFHSPNQSSCCIGCVNIQQLYFNVQFIRIN